MPRRPSLPRVGHVGGPETGDGPIHRIRVRVGGQDYTVRARDGYHSR